MRNSFLIALLVSLFFVAIALLIKPDSVEDTGSDIGILDFDTTAIDAIAPASDATVLSDDSTVTDQ